MNQSKTRSNKETEQLSIIEFLQRNYGTLVNPIIIFFLWVPNFYAISSITDLVGVDMVRSVGIVWYLKLLVDSFNFQKYYII